MRREGPAEKATLVADTRLAHDSVIVSGRSRWTVVDHAFDVDVLLPARRLVGLLPAVARGMPIALTTNRNLETLGSAVDIGRVLRNVVVVRCPPAPELAELADELLWSMVQGNGGDGRRRR